MDFIISTPRGARMDASTAETDTGAPSGAPKKRSLRDSVAGLFGGDPPLLAPASAVAADASKMIPGAHTSVLPDDDGGVPSVAPARKASRALREGLQDLYKSAQVARQSNYQGGAQASAASVEAPHVGVLPGVEGGVPTAAPAVDASSALSEGLQDIDNNAEDAQFCGAVGAHAKAGLVDISHDEGSSSAAVISAVPARLAASTVGGKARVSFSNEPDGMSALVSDRFKMDSPSSGPPLGTGAASLLEGAVGTPSASSRPQWPEYTSSGPLWNEPWKDQLRYVPKAAGVVGEGRVIVSGCGPGAVSAIGKRRDALPTRASHTPFEQDRLLVASRHHNGVYRGAVDRPQIEKTHALSTVPAEILAATVEKAAIKFVNLIPLFAVPGAWAPDPEMSKSAMWEFVSGTLRMAPVAGKNGELLDRGRLFLLDFREYLNSVKHAARERAQPIDGIYDVLPISRQESIDVYNWLRGLVAPTGEYLRRAAIKRVPLALKWLAKVFPKYIDSSAADLMVLHVGGSLPTGDKARASDEEERHATSPRIVQMIETAAAYVETHAKWGVGDAIVEGMRHMMLQVKASPRSRQYSELVPHIAPRRKVVGPMLKPEITARDLAPGISTLVASVPNKSKRCLEFTFIPELNYTRPGIAAWQRPLIEECAWREFMVPKWYNPVPDDNHSQVYPTAAGPSLVDPASLSTLEDLRPPPHTKFSPRAILACDERPVRFGQEHEHRGGRICASFDAWGDAVTDLRSIASGIPVQELKRIGQAGRHCEHFIGAQVTVRLAWPDREGDLIGQWVTASDKDKPGAGARASTRKAPPTTRESYARSTSSEEHMLIRRRYAAAMQAAFALKHSELFPSVPFTEEGVVECPFPQELTWLDMFPLPPPEQLAQFYGPWREACKALSAQGADAPAWAAGMSSIPA